MGKTVLAVEANPEILRWARETLGYSIKEAAKKIGIKEEKLIEIEKGNKTIAMTMNQLRTAADIYKRPLPIFFSSKVPDTFQIPDYRIKEVIIPDENQRALVNIVQREKLEFKKNAETLYELNGNEIDYSYIGNISPSNPIDTTADEVIQILKVDHLDLRKLKDNDVLNYWIKKVEDLGIMVFQFQKIEPKYLRGFVYADTPFPVIAINQKDSYYARCFTLIHEFCHVLLRRSGIGDIDYSQEPVDRIEAFCNKITSRVLMPERLLEPQKLNIQDNEKKLEESIQDISKIFKVSHSAALYRLYSLGKITQPLFNKMIAKIENKQKPKKQKGGDYYVLYVSQMSKNYIYEVLEASQNQLISHYEVLRFMDLKHKTFEALMKKVGNGEVKL